jgi:hypothetical protein
MRREHANPAVMLATLLTKSKDGSRSDAARGIRHRTSVTMLLQQLDLSFAYGSF